MLNRRKRPTPIRTNDEQKKSIDLIVFALKTSHCLFLLFGIDPMCNDHAQSTFRCGTVNHFIAANNVLSMHVCLSSSVLAPLLLPPDVFALVFFCCFYTSALPLISFSLWFINKLYELCFSVLWTDTTYLKMLAFCSIIITIATDYVIPAIERCKLEHQAVYLREFLVHCNAQLKLMWYGWMHTLTYEMEHTLTKLETNRERKKQQNS